MEDLVSLYEIGAVFFKLMWWGEIVVLCGGFNEVICVVWDHIGSGVCRRGVFSWCVLCVILMSYGESLLLWINYYVVEMVVLIWSMEELCVGR